MTSNCERRSTQRASCQSKHKRHAEIARKRNFNTSKKKPLSKAETSMDAVRPMTRSMHKMLRNPNSNPRGTNPGPGEGSSSGAVRPMTRSVNKMLQNPNSNPRGTNPGPGEGSSSGAVKPKKRNTQRNPNPRERNPGPSEGTVHHQANPNFRPNDGRPPCNEKEEIAILRSQLQESLTLQQTNHYKMVATNHKAAKYKTQLDWVHLQLNCCRQNAEKTIQVLQEQLEEARRNRPKSCTEENFPPQLSDAPTKPVENFDALEELSSHHAAELHVEASTQTTEASHTDSVELQATREADLEIQCKKQQEQIDQLQERLLKAQKQLEEEAAKCKEEEERARCEIAELKAKLCTSEEIEEVKNLQQQTLLSVQDTLQTQQGKEANLGKEGNVTKLDGPETKSENIAEEKPKKKKKKRHWLLRLFTRGSAASARSPTKSH